MAEQGIWRIWVDTGGTFTDCLAVDPQGDVHRAKVLSTSALRGRVVARLDERRWRIEAPWQAPAGFFAGFRLRRLGAEVTTAVAGYEAGERVLELVGEPAQLGAGDGFELLSDEEAPVLAARLVTATPPGRPLPPIALRLATTRGTNALLEAKGARTALLITRGFGDLLAIGTQQRPDLFALAVVKPEPLPEVVVEVEERLAADGSVLLPLDEAAVERAGRELRAQGFAAAAVAFLHAYRDPSHECAAKAALERSGLVHVSASAELAPRIKILPRAETAVVDAYLSPVIRGYLERVGAALGGGSLHVMTSAGGLVRAQGFHPKDSLLSGPAGGVVGAARAGRRAGFARLIAFDMGGTSTDVARYDGDFDYAFEHQVGSARLAAPALGVESVAAGGGSICSFDGVQLAVGPASAGAQPGPACYGAGGPLTLTDVNLLLGRLAPGFFGIPLDEGAARRAFAGLLDRVLRAEGSPALASEAVLEGLLAIADERMAGAIRTISVARGYDPADYALLAFGGAGGQHACAVAALLGISTVVVPPDAGLLSAAGLGAAVIERFRERQVLAPLAAVEGAIAGWLAELGCQAAAAVAAEGLTPDEIEVRRRIVRLRLLGQEAALPIEWSATVDLGAAFATAYESQYGYLPPARRAVEVESLQVVASSRPEPNPPGCVALAARLGEPGRVAPSRASLRAFFDGAWREVPAFARPDLAAGDRLRGPALVLEAHATTVVPPGWEGAVVESGALALRTSAARRQAYRAG